MRKLYNTDINQVFEYISLEPEYNLFIYGDIKSYGLDGDVVEVFAHDIAGKRDSFDFIVLRYFKNFIVYSQHDDYDDLAVVEFLKSQDIQCISGKSAIVKRLAKHFDMLTPKPTFLARLNASTGVMPKLQMEEVKADSAEDILCLFKQIDEFSGTYKGEAESESLDHIRENLMTSGHAFGIYKDNKLCALAQSSAENDKSAMIIGVATLPEYRMRGYATNAMLAVSKCCFDTGIEFVCLFYDNPKAARIYKKAGFKILGEYMLIQ